MPLIALALAAGLAAQAVDADEQDARCVAAIALVGAIQGDKADPGLAAGMFYFIGRLDARSPHYDIEAALRRLASAPNAGELLRPDMIRCGGILQERGTFMKGVGDRLKGKQ